MLKMKLISHCWLLLKPVWLLKMKLISHCWQQLKPVSLLIKWNLSASVVYSQNLFDCLKQNLFASKTCSLTCLIVEKTNILSLCCKLVRFFILAVFVRLFWPVRSFFMSVCLFWPVHLALPCLFVQKNTVGACTCLFMIVCARSWSVMIGRVKST